MTALSRLLAALSQVPTAKTPKLYSSDDLPTLAGFAMPDANWTVLALGAERPPVRCQPQWVGGDGRRLDWPAIGWH